MHSNVCEAQDHNQYDFYLEKANECIKVVVISLADTGPKPHAMVIISEDAIATHMAVRSPWRPENVAGLTVFEFHNLILLMTYLIVEYAITSVRLFILICDVLFCIIPRSCRNDSWVRRSCEYEVDVNKRYKANLDNH